jgi:integrase
MLDEKRNKVKSITKKRDKLAIEYYDATGKIRQKSTKFEPTETNRKKLWKLVPEFERGLIERQKKQEAKSFGYYADMFLALKKENTKFETMKNYVIQFKQCFGEDTLPQDIKLTAVKKFFANITKKNGDNVVRTTKVQWRSTLKNIFQLALEDEELSVNIVSNWELPKQNDPPSDIKPFTPDELILLLKHSTGSLHNYLGIGMWTGLRPEEEIALMIEDIDFEARLIHVRRAFSKHSNNNYTKTQNSLRTIPLLDGAKEYLKEQIVYAKSKESLYLFCLEDGSKPKSNEAVTGRCELWKEGKRLK